MFALRYIGDRVNRSRQLRIFILTYSAYAILYATRKPFSVVKTQVQDDMNLTTHVLGLVDSAFLGAYAIGQLVLPALLGRTHLSPNRMLLLLYGGSGLMALGFGFAHSGAALVCLWLMNGLLHSAVFPILVSCVSPWFSAEKRGQVMGTWTTSQQVGATCATLFSAYVAKATNWRMVFILPGVFTIGFGWFLNATLFSAPPPSTNEPSKIDVELGLKPAIMRHPSSADHTGTTATPSHTAKDSPQQTSPAKNSLPPVSINVGSSPLSLRVLLTVPDIKPVGVAYFCVKCVRYSLLFWLPYYLTTELHYESAVAGYASIVFDVGGIFGGIMCGQLADRFLAGRRLFMALMTGATSALALVLFALGAHHSSFVALTLMMLVGFTVAGSDSIIGGSAPSDLCDRAGLDGAFLSAASGIVNGLGSMGAVLQGSMTAYVSEAYGWGCLYALLAGASLTSSLFLAWPAINESSCLTSNRR
eukprot:Gregarina_sp_Poly_1__7168@NODE_392_length_8959_cov_63_078835_g321_i0_p2_GENE_NODE_392_length_8959_cov_63_078835_g321_i0NODE_392_length_8959_cov_63_078835_g321_i0_p2_ORF_typecomplete_len474_score39_79MFS_1/PF07690_16/1_6e44MFS_1/PF07690_16/6MFS_3/PF05977_13/1_8e09MFS_3/PF05977_13/7_6e06MFS_4/PF06779_14/1_2e11MFS_4/PF06779_14/9_4e02Sugar_tr/PF00083_24/5_5e06Sugar_tr/PF00083_24/0_18Nuc_H_symport/PF03825_16/5_4e02Nuc_H_symport/PF03825_16/0_0032Nuc_H_symport/PF03825_16/5_8e03BT1/PF03092_16/77BT1/PF03